MKKRRLLILAVIILGSYCTGLIADTVTVEANLDQCAAAAKQAPYVSFYGVTLTNMPVGNVNGSLGTMWAGYIQLDLSAYAGRTVTSDGQLQFYARIQAGDTAQPEGYMVSELDRNWVYGDVCWEESAWGVPWTDIGSSDLWVWDKAGCYDRSGFVGNFSPTTTDYESIMLTVPKATIQGWVDSGSPTSFLFSVAEVGFDIYYYFDRVIEIGAAGMGSPGKPSLTFDCLELTNASVELGNSVSSNKASPYTSYFNAEQGSDYLSVGNSHGLNDQIAACYMQADMTEVNDIVEIVGDGILRFEARIAAGQDPQNEGFQVHELDVDYVQSECCWYEYSYLNSWTDTGADFWDYAGCGDTNSLVGTFGVADTNWAPISLTVPESVLQGWVDGTPSSLLWAIHENYYNAYYHTKVINVSGDGWYSTCKPTIEFTYVAEPVCGDYAHLYPAGDVDKNCVTDMHDLAIMGANWLVCTAPECD